MLEDFCDIGCFPKKMRGSYSRIDSSDELETGWGLRLSRYIGLLTILTLIVYIPYQFIQSDGPTQYEQPSNCSQSAFNTLSQMRTRTLDTHIDKVKLKLPFYSNLDLNEQNDGITQAVILQHGNLRNADQYYCAALSAIGNLQNTLIIVPQFYIDSDTCYSDALNQYVRINSSLESTTCGFPVWTSEGWKDGLKSINIPEIYSYDIYDIYINHISKNRVFPNLKLISLFGFSAGAQTLLRYSIFSNYNIVNRIHVKYVISDPSTYVYFNKERPHVNVSSGFGIPDESWIQPGWKVNDQINAFNMNVCINYV